MIDHLRDYSSLTIYRNHYKHRKKIESTESDNKFITDSNDHGRIIVKSST